MTAGRPSSYRTEFPEQAYRLCLLGLTDAELAEYFQVDEATLHRWKAAHPEFRESIARGKLGADADVADKLYRRACGYSHDAVKIFMPAGAAEPVYAPYVERYPPDTQAASLWLRNRQPKRWRDRQEITGADGQALLEAHVVMVQRIVSALTVGGPVTIEGEITGEGET